MCFRKRIPVTTQAVEITRNGVVVNGETRTAEIRVGAFEKLVRAMFGMPNHHLVLQMESRNSVEITSSTEGINSRLSFPVIKR